MFPAKNYLIWIMIHDRTFMGGTSKLFADDPVLPLKDHLDTERAREGEKRHTRNAVHEAEIEIESDQ